MRLLIHETSYRRLEAQISAHGAAVEPLVMDETGAVRLNGQPLGPDDIQAEAGWVNNDIFFSAAMRSFLAALNGSQNLKWVQSGAAGVDHPIFQRFLERGLTFTTSHGQAVGIAEYVIAGALDALQRGPERRAAQAAGRWERIDFREVGGSRWLVIGFGAIGQGVADRARALGAHVTGVRRSATAHPAADRMATLQDAVALAGEADVVALCCPLTDQTRRIADAAFFASMKPQSILVNVGRGGLVDEAALLAALDRGIPERAILDVFEAEPLPADSRFWTHPRVSLTAHASGATAGQQPRNDAIFLENLKLYLAGQPLRHQVTASD